jgi:hypothetical protein
MTTKIVYQYDATGAYVGPTVADESPMEPGVWLLPARTTEAEPPECGVDEMQQWNGAAWQVVTRPPQPTAAEIAIAKLKSFLDANPDVAAQINQGSL